MIIILGSFFRKKTPKEKAIELQCKIALLEKELEVLWKFETNGGYLLGKRTEIIEVEKDLAFMKKLRELSV